MDNKEFNNHQHAHMERARELKRKSETPAHTPAHVKAYKFVEKNARALSKRPRRRTSSAPSTQPFIVRMINSWTTRVIAAVFSGKFAQETEIYAEHQTTRDFIWNSLGQAAWGATFPLITIIATQLVGAEDAGVFSLAFALALILYFIGSFGVRTYQVSDLDELSSFNDYQISRALAILAMLAAGSIYLAIHPGEGAFSSIAWALILYRVGDAAADVFEGRLQQKDKLYLAGISQAVRCAGALLAFTLALIITRNITLASWTLMWVHSALTMFVSVPLAYFETDRSLPLRISGIRQILQACWPAALAFLLYNLIDSMPKFAMESTLSFDNQLYYNALYFPAHTIVMVAAVLYKPQLVRLAGFLNSGDKNVKFNVLVALNCGVIVAITAVTLLVMHAIGIWFMGILYGLDFEPLRHEAYLMVVAGGLASLIDFLYQVATIKRQHIRITRAYVLSFIMSIPVAYMLVAFSGLTGAVLASIIELSILMLLIINELLSTKKAR